MTSTPELPSEQAHASATQAAPDFAPEVVASLYRYRKRSLWVCRLLVCFGFLGLHRFYVGKPFTGFLMLLSAGGGLVWDSDSNEEYQETFDKAAAMFTFFGQ